MRTGKFTGFKFDVIHSDYMGGCYHLQFTDNNNQTWCPTIAFGIYRHETEESAWKQMDDYDRSIYIENLPELDYEQYRSECAKLGLKPDPMEWDGYNIKYWDSGVAVATLEHDSAVKLARKHQKFLDKQAESKPKPKSPAPEMILCDCGHRVPKGCAMSASLGTSCADCYDDMSG